MRNVAMAPANGKVEGCVVCEAGLECGLSPNNEKGKVGIDSSFHFYVVSSSFNHLQCASLANANVYCRWSRNPQLASFVSWVSVKAVSHRDYFNSMCLSRLAAWCTSSKCSW